MSASTFEKVRATLRRVSRTGQSQAESMCAWPTAVTRCALAWAGAASTAASSLRPAAAVPATSSGSTASHMRSSAARISARRDDAGSSWPMSPRSVHTSRSSSQTASSRHARSIVRSR